MNKIFVATGCLRGRRLQLFVSLAVLGISLGGCATVTVSQEGAGLTSVATYEERKDFFLWGLIGEHEVDVVAVCAGESPRQMQTQMTPVDAALGFITLGLYAPRTARVWCD